MNHSCSNVYDHLLVFLYANSLSSNQRLTCEVVIRLTRIIRPIIGHPDPPAIGTSGYVYYGWLNYRKFETHYRKFETFLRKFETCVENLPAACVESAQTFYNPTNCWRLWLRPTSSGKRCGRLHFVSTPTYSWKRTSSTTRETKLPL